LDNKKLSHDNVGDLVGMVDALLEVTHDLCAIVDSNYRYIWANKAYRDRHGLQREGIMGQSVPDVLGADYFRTVVQPRIDRCLAGATQRYEAEREYRRLGPRKLLIRYYPIDVPGRLEKCIGAVVTDVTETREIEDELLRQAGLLEMAATVARFGGFLVDLGNRHIQWSNVVAEMHGMPHGYTPSINEALSFYVPECRERIRTAFNACAEKGIPYDEELQIIDARGLPLQVREVAEPVFDEEGRITQVQGAFQDITGQREKEAELRRLSHIVEQSPAAITITDLEGHIEYVNPAFEQLSGYSMGELLGKTPSLIRGGDTPSAIYRELWETIRSGRIWRGELKNRRKDGTSYWESEVISPLKNESGHITHYVAIKEDITALKEAEQQLSQMAFQDRLTGLQSRLGFHWQLKHHMKRHGWQSSAAVVMINITGLRNINDAYGYDFGDQLLAEFARRLQQEAVKPDLVGRLGGDEFTLLVLPDFSEALENDLRRLVDLLLAPFELDGIVIEIGVRLGYSRLGERVRPIEDLLRESERALFRHGSEAIQPWVAYSDRLRDEDLQRISLARELRQAISEHQFELHFQPKVDLTTGALIACEALIRWNHPTRGLVSPGVFIPIAEQSQLIAPIGEWVLRRACQHLKEWRDAGLQAVRVAVNVSVVQFQMGDFAGRVRAVLEECEVAPGELALEVTESVFERESDVLLEQMSALRDMGVWLSLDDFGTGYSSLLYLQRYPFNEIKIDQGFVFHMLDDPFNHNIVEAVMMLARALKATVIAEGIESDEVARALLAIGCGSGQGYFYSMPLEAEDFRWLLEQRSLLPLGRR